jgi:hypothetical protein
MYKNMRIVTMGMQFEDEWDRIFVPTIDLKYTHMRCNLGSDIQMQYLGEFNQSKSYDVCYLTMHYHVHVHIQTIKIGMTLTLISSRM